MSTIDRYKKKGGFLQLLAVLEGSSQQKQDQFFNLIGAESKAWEATLKKKMLSIDKIFNWSPEHLTDIFASIPPLTTAMIMHGRPADQIEFYFKYLDPKHKRKIMDLMNEKVPSAGEKAACAQRVIQEVRGMITKGQLKMEKVDPELAIEENIEFHIESSAAGFNTGSTSYNSAKEETASIGVIESEPTAEGTTLRFELPSKTDSNVNTSDVEALKRKVQNLAKELDQLKHENQNLRSRLDQIRKIA